MTAEQLQQGWTPRRVGRRVVTLSEIDSTNTTALDALAEPNADGLAVLADFQASGRGRQGRSWLSPRCASVLCSVALVQPQGQTHWPEARMGGYLTLVTAVATCEAVRSATEVTPTIKWPNDLLVDGKKLAGILVESRLTGDSGRGWVLGIGINCLQHIGHFPPELQEAATSLELAVSHGVDRLGVARQLLQALDVWLAEEPDEGKVHDAWSLFAEPLGRRVRLRRDGQEFTGRTVEVDPAGGLVLQCDDGRREWFDPMLTTAM